MRVWLREGRRRLRVRGRACGPAHAEAGASDNASNGAFSNGAFSDAAFSNAAFSNGASDAAPSTLPHVVERAHDRRPSSAPTRPVKES